MPNGSQPGVAWYQKPGGGGWYRRVAASTDRRLGFKCFDCNIVLIEPIPSWFICPRCRRIYNLSMSFLSEKLPGINATEGSLQKVIAAFSGRLE